MFKPDTYIKRRSVLSSALSSGIVLFLGNDESSMNYAANTYHFRQDSTFLYFFGINQPGLNGIIDLDQGKTIIFGNELTMDDVVWTGPLPTLAKQAGNAGITEVRPASGLADVLKKANLEDRKIHFLPPYRGHNKIKIFDLLGVHPSETTEAASMELIQAVVKQRNIKTPEEIVEIEKAVNLTGKMHIAAMRAARPGIIEAEVYAEMMKVLYAADAQISFPPIVTVNGQVLHNHHHHNLLTSGQLLLVDCGAETNSNYAGDMTRTFPVDPNFTEKQKEVYQVCLNAQEDAAKALRPGISYKEVHFISCRTIVNGLSSIGLMKGNVDDAVAAGAHALFFPHGLGHMMGMDVHDMENVGENNVGYTDSIKRSDQFGLAFLRLGRTLETGFVITVEPGIYFIPELINMWKDEGKFNEFINYSALENYLDFGGIRIEEDFLITSDGYRLLGDPVAKSVVEVESVRSGMMA